MKHKHHIIPRHMGGSDDPNNLIELTVEEHAEAHRFLFETYGKVEDYIAWKTLSGQIGKDEALTLARSIGGKTLMSEESKEKLRQSCKERYLRQKQNGVWEEANRKRSESLKGRERSPEHAKNNAESRKSNGKPWHSEETRAKIAEAVRRSQTGKKRGPYKKNK